MPFADGPQAENEAQAAFRRSRLIGVRHDAGVEQRGGLERIFVEKIGAEKLALDLGKSVVCRERVFHVVGTKLKGLQQIAMAPLKILQYVSQQAGRGLRVECKNAFDDMVGARLV